MAMTPASLPSIATKITVAPSRRSALGLALRAHRSRCRARRGTSHCRARRAGARPCRSRPCRSGESKPMTRRERDAALARGRDDRRGQRMLARALDARGEAQHLVRRDGRAAGTIATTFGLPSVSVPVLSTTSVSTFSMRSSASAFLISTPACAPRPTPTMIDIGVASPSAQGQAMISTRDGRDQPIGEARLRPEHRPGGEGEHRDRDHRRHEPARHLVGEPLDRRARALRLRHHLHDLREHACRGRPSRRASRSRPVG